MDENSENNHSSAEGKLPPDDLFSSTAAYYAKYRPAYPQEVFKWLVNEYNLDGTGRLLDGGCGTGQVLVPFAKHFKEIVAFDFDSQMVEECRKLLPAELVDKVTLLKMKGEDISPELGNFRMATFGASFHWMDRPKVANLVYNQLNEGGCLAIIAPSSTWSGEETEWKQFVRKTITDRLGDERRAGSSIFKPQGTHEQALADSNFSGVKRMEFYKEHVWTIDSLIGYLYSTSFASRAVLGEKAAAFEEDLRQRLYDLDPSGRFTENIETTLITAQKG